MAIYKCVTHNVVLIVEVDKRTFHNPPGAWGGMPTCLLLTTKVLTEGKHGECEFIQENGPAP